MKTDERKRVVVIGGGPAGMMAAYAAALCGHRVILLEKNEKLGKKLYITGKGRCNVTNAGEIEDIMAHVMSNPKFLYSALYTFGNQALMGFMEEHGVPLKVERGNRVFPVSDHSSDIIAACARALKERGVEVRLGCQVDSLLLEDGRCVGVSFVPESGEKGRGVLPELRGERVIVATGGVSYPSTGSTGDGYRFAEESGHRLIPAVPALVPFTVREDWVRQLQGLSLKNTGISVYSGKKKLYEDFGEMLFTHFGVSGPMILSASAAIPPKYFDRPLSLFIDLKPALDAEMLDRRLLRTFDEGKNKAFKNAADGLFPGKLTPVMVALSGIGPEKKVHEITRRERAEFGALIKRLPLTVTGKRDFREAIITKGGVSVGDVDPSTMCSKRVEGLSFCGEVLDLDAATGGYNLQIAWSTGYLAGISA